MKQPGLFDFSEQQKKLLKTRDFLERVSLLVAWETFRPVLDKALERKNHDKGGRPAYDAVLMFKVLVLQALYNLSDEQTEYQILDRMSFTRFLGLELCDAVPDARTIWLFREKLIAAEAVEKLFAQFDAMLSTAGFTASGGQIIDATFVEVPRQRNSRDDNETIKKGEVPADWNDKKKAHKDTDARWTKKNKTAFYGYKNHVNVDRKHKLIRKYKVTDASVHDSQELDNVLDPNNDAQETSPAPGLVSALRQKGSKIASRQPHLFDRALAVLGPLLACVALVEDPARGGLGQKRSNGDRSRRSMSLASSVGFSPLLARNRPGTSRPRRARGREFPSPRRAFLVGRSMPARDNW
jgi:IS5 family transposase